MNLKYDIVTLWQVATQTFPSVWDNGIDEMQDDIQLNEMIY